MCAECMLVNVALYAGRPVFFFQCCMLIIWDGLGMKLNGRDGWVKVLH